MLLHYLFSVLLIITCFKNVFALNEVFERSSILYGVAVQANEQVRKNGSKSSCYKDLTEFYDAVDKKYVWAYKMMDVSGRPNQGFLAGNNGWTGQSTICADLTNRDPPEVFRAKVVQMVTDHDFPPFEMGFVAAYLRHDNQLQMKTNLPSQDKINLGLCTPISCTGEEIQPLLERLFQKQVLTFQKLYNTNFKIEGMKTVATTNGWFTENLLNQIILSIILGLMIFIATVSYYDLNIYQNKQNEKTENIIEDEKSINKEEDKNEEDPVETIQKANSIIDRFLLCFSWTKTYKLLLKSDVPKNVGAINGMMFFTMLHIALYFYLIYSAPYIRNLPMNFKNYESFFGQFVANSSFSIDSYLFLSGCLVSYSFYKYRRDIVMKSGFFGRIIEFFVMIIGRIFRTLPIYMLWILWSIFTFSYLDAKWPAPLTENAHKACPETWWRNILYINNLYPRHSDDNCMSWSWLLAADMQYYIVNTALLILSTISLKSTITITLGIIGFCIYSTGQAAYDIKYIHTLDQQMLQHDAIYQLPWHRIGPYAIGMLTGLLIYKFNGKLPLKKKYINLCWAIIPLINLYLIFGLIELKPSVEFSAIYISVGRTAWAVGLAWILIACSTGNAGFINTILSYEGMKLFHKLSYSSYIFMVANLIFICITYETTIYLSTLATISQVLSTVFFPYFVNLFISLHYEFPFELLWKTFVRKQIV